MKKIAMFVLIAVTFVSPAFVFGQNQTPQSDTVLVRKSDLPPELVKQLESQKEIAQMAQKIETYGRWVGLGKEVGTAVNDSLSSLTDQADKFAKTDVGKFAMFIVAYKVLGQDLMGMLVGIPMLIAFNIFFVWSYRKHCVQRVLPVKISKDEKTYKTVNDNTEERGNWALVHFVLFLIINSLIVAQVMF